VTMFIKAYCQGT